jgi:NAD-dependent dihydropyrimidine dehydrogenase PreA subunit
MNHQSKLDKKFAIWKGIPREEIEWHPTVDKDKCTGCGMCVTSCGRNVFDFDPENNKAVVARPLQCMVGCTSCQVWCIYEAISFPDPNDIKSLIKKRGVLKLAKQQLREKMDRGENVAEQFNKTTASNEQ